MKVRISYTVEVDDKYRRAINARFGKPGLATRQEVKEFLEIHGSSIDDDLMHELDDSEEPVGYIWETE